MRRVWVCDSCNNHDTSMPWNCPSCDQETCEHCFDKYAHCKNCCKNKTDEQLIISANKYGWDFT